MDETKPTAASPAPSPRDVGDAMVRWARTRRARTMVLAVVLCATGLGLIRHETGYHDMSSFYPWTSRGPGFPAILHSAFKAPSNLTLQLENGQVDHVPPRLKKTTPNFHLIMPSERDSAGFCKATLSAMVLDYPPPTVVQFGSRHRSSRERQDAIVKDTLGYLSNTRLVHDHDLVLIADAQDTRFQLPPDVMIAQYKQLLVDANARLLKRYGTDGHGFQKFNQTIVFVAQKTCEGDEVACRYMPPSVLPDDLYGGGGGGGVSETPARFINSRIAMGPANDLRTLYQAVQTRLEQRTSQSSTAESVFATLFAEQQLSRDAFEAETKSPAAKLNDFIHGKPATKQRLDHAPSDRFNLTQRDFGLGLDYTHTLFQPLAHTAPNELLTTTTHNTSTLSLPPALFASHRPFARPDSSSSTPSPNQKAPYMQSLAYTLALDALPDRSTPWSALALVQNTYTRAVPAALTTPTTAMPLWYTPHQRALLRARMRAYQSPAGYHDALVGGDRQWDLRGGRGGVWAAPWLVWWPWGEVGGVCAGVEDMRAAFGDGKGVWLREGEVDNEEGRRKALALVDKGAGEV